MAASETVVVVGAEALRVFLKGGLQLDLSPVPMKRMPSASPEDWLAFQGEHVAGTEMSADMLARVQLFMRAHGTEALSDGKRFLTVAGHQLALCRPDAIG